MRTESDSMGTIGDSAIEVGRDKIRVLSQIADGLVVVAHIAVRKISIEVGKRIIWIEADRLGKVVDSLVVLRSVRIISPRSK